MRALSGGFRNSNSLDSMHLVIFGVASTGYSQGRGSLGRADLINLFLGHEGIGPRATQGFEATQFPNIIKVALLHHALCLVLHFRHLRIIGEVGNTPIVSKLAMKSCPQFLHSRTELICSTNWSSFLRANVDSF